MVWGQDEGEVEQSFVGEVKDYANDNDENNPRMIQIQKYHNDDRKDTDIENNLNAHMDVESE